jgi:hypothetical protein
LHASIALVAAGRGEEALAAEHVAAAQRSADRFGLAPQLVAAARAAGAVAHARGDYAGVLRAFEPLRSATYALGGRVSYHQLLWTPTLIEALIAFRWWLRSTPTPDRPPRRAAESVGRPYP